MVAFFYTAGLTIQQSPTYIPAKDYNALYFNGYLNFCFNGVTKLFTGDKLKDNLQTNSASSVKIGYNAKSDNDLKSNINTFNKKNKTIQDRIEVSVNNMLRNMLGRDINGIADELINLPKR